MDEERLQRRGCVLSLVPGCSSGDETGSDLVSLDCYVHIFLLLPGEKMAPCLSSLPAHCSWPQTVRQSNVSIVNSFSVKNTVLQIWFV